jgi:hypothetical protein
MTDDTILLRQAHPNFMDGEFPTSQVFLPFPKDHGKLSVYDGDLISPEKAHRHYTGVLGYDSHSVWGVSRAEAVTAGTHPVPDPLEGFPEHALIDFQEMTGRQCRKTAKKLKAFAMARECLFATARDGTP